MMLHGSQSPTPGPHQSPISPAAASTNGAPAATTPATATTTTPRKRKAETQENERLNKRLSLLNLEQNGSKLYVPVEEPSASTHDHAAAPVIPPGTIAAPTPPNAAIAAVGEEDDIMRLDDTKHKVYIYNIDDELSSSDDDTASDDGRLVFLPDIQKHLMANRIPPAVLANADGELAGMQLVLYSDPKSLSVPEEQDGVRKAVIEARQRLRDRRAGRLEESSPSENPGTVASQPASSHAGASGSGGTSWDAHSNGSDSPDAMDMD